MKILGQEIFLLILDVDGVLTRFSHIAKIFRQTGKELGLPVENVSEHFKEARKGMFPMHSRFKDTVVGVWPELAHNKGKVSGIVAILRKKEKEHSYHAHKGVNEFLLWAKEEGLLLAICTRNNHEALAHKLQSVGIDKNLFSVSHVPGRYTKPDPECIRFILRKTGIAKENSLFVGDWFPDLNTARNAGVTFIATTCGVLGRKAFLDVGVPKHCIVKTLPDLRNLVTQ